MRKKLRLVSMLLAMLLAASCSMQPKNMQAQGTNEFIFWMDSYIAAPRSSEWSVAVTYYYQPDQPHLNMEDVVSIAFSDVDAVKVTSYMTDELSMGEDTEYEAVSIGLRLSFDEMGQYQTDEMTFFFSDGSAVNYPIGQWYFDIGQEQTATAAVNQDGSPAASAKSEVFPFRYTVNDPSFVIETIQYGEDQVINITGSSTRLSEAALTSGAPVQYIRPKIVLRSGGETLIAYGDGCYCGALDIDAGDVQKSIDHARAGR